VLTDVLLRRIVDDTARTLGINIGAGAMPALMELLTQRVNNALVRHESLLWLAETGLDLRLYGRGWENHPRLARFARGVADNGTDLAAIYRCSRINLQVTPFGCVHQRMLDGLAAGGFFLARWNQGDSMGQPYRGIWAWCDANGVTNDDEMRRRMPADVAALVRRIDELHAYDTATYDMPLFELVRTAADCDFTLAADSIWGDDYDRVSFRSREELHAKARAALADADGCRATALRMRTAAVERFSYRAITARLLDLIASGLGGAGPPPPTTVPGVSFTAAEAA
jgi:hypothetical protein